MCYIQFMLKTITVREDLTRDRSAWIVKLDGHEVTNHGDNALTFDLHDDALDFAYQLRSEYGPDAHVEIILLDDLGLPVAHESDTPASGMNERDFLLADPTTPLSRATDLIVKAVYYHSPAPHKKALLLALYAPLLPKWAWATLARLEPEFLVAALKRLLGRRGQSEQQAA